MRCFYLISIGCLVCFTACSGTKKPSAANITTAVNQYLASHGQVCISVGGQFPINIPVSQQSNQNGATAKLSALEHAGLVNATDTTAVVQNLANSLSLSPHKPEPVKRYTVSGEGQKYFQSIMTDSGRTGGFCYGQKQVDSIVKWTEPVTVGSISQTEVTYTYRIVNLAAWAERPEIRRAFSDVQATVAGQSNSTQVAGLQLTNKGWEVPGQ